jgi:hypothetical protein
MSLCFLQAFEEKQKGNITEAEYIHHLLAHCQGIEHDGDDWTKEDWALLKADPFGYSVRCWSLRIAPWTFKCENTHVYTCLISPNKKQADIDITPFEDVFTAYRTGDIAEIKDKLDRLNEENVEYLRKSLAMLALQERKADILKFCFEKSFAYENYFVDEANRVQADKDADPELVKVVEESEMRKMYRWVAPRDEDDDWDEDSEEEELDEDPCGVFDYGGKYDVGW